VVDKVS